MLEKSEKYDFVFNQIIDLCNQKNITVSNLIKKFSTSTSAMTAWKKGNIPPATLAKLSDFFGVSVDYIITGKQETRLTLNEQEIINLVRKFDEREQIKIIGRLEELYDLKIRRENIGIQVARTTDGKPVRHEVTPEILEKIKELPEDTDY